MEIDPAWGVIRFGVSSGIPQQMDGLLFQVLEEADLDEDGKLSYTEFEHVISRSTDFLR